MKRVVLFLAGIIYLVSCSDLDSVVVDNPITVSSPSPTEEIWTIGLNEAQSAYVAAGNDMSFKLLGEIYDGENLIYSPLSLQYAMSMVANGAKGETLDEIVDFLGYGKDGLDALNEYSRIMLEQLPAVDLDVTLKVTNALLVNDRHPLLPAYKNSVENNFYAAVDNMDFSDPNQIAARINEWSRANTNGFIDKVLEPSEISKESLVYLMNALYFKAEWSHMGMFKEEDTKSESFKRHNGRTTKVKMMNNSGSHSYAIMDGYKVLALPYSNGKFNMYVLLPDENDIEGMIKTLQNTAWSDILGNLKSDAKVHVKLPKFEIENKYDLKNCLINLGVEKAFSSKSADFSGMFKANNLLAEINKVIQKSRISVTEWGTEAGSVTEVGMLCGSAGSGPKNEVYFHADHPFVFVIGEKNSKTILFTGVVMKP